MRVVFLSKDWRECVNFPNEQVNRNRMRRRGMDCRRTTACICDAF